MQPLPLFVSPGRHLVARINDLLVFAEGDDDHLRRLTNELTELLPEAMWTGLLRFLASKISTVGFDVHPPIACLEVLDDAVNIFVFGDITLTVETTLDSQTITGAGMTTWREISVPGEARSIVGGNADYSTGLVGMLARGLVAGGGFSLTADGPPTGPGSLLNAISGATTVAATAASPELTNDDGAVLDQPAASPEAAFAPALQSDEPEVEPTPLPEPVYEVVPDVVPEGEARPDAIDTPVEDVAADQAEPESDFSDETVSSLSDGEILTPDQLARTETLPAPIVDNAGAATAPPADDVDDLEDVEDVEDVEEIEEVDDDFDPHATSAFTGVALSDAVRAARSATPDPRRTSGPESEAGNAVAASNEPELRGVQCPNGHLSSMQDPVCRTCSEPVDMDGPIIAGPRPILGVIEFDDGVRIPLDHPVVIGRQPPEDYHINGEPAYVVPITDEEGLISRVHVEVHLIGWDVELIDKNSVNGTFTSSSTDATSRTRLRSEHPTQIEIGTIIYVGDRVFRLNTGHVV